MELEIGVAYEDDHKLEIGITCDLQEILLNPSCLRLHVIFIFQD